MEPPKEPEFLFINTNSQSRSRSNAAARAVRQHVMRDIGRARRKRRNPQFELELRPAAEATQAGSSQAATERAEETESDEPIISQTAEQEQVSALPRPFWNQHPAKMFENNLPMDPFAAYSLALALSEQLVPQRGTGTSAPPIRVKRFWFPLAYSDSEFFRNMLLGTAMTDAARGKNAETNYELSVARYTSGLRCINSRVTSQDLQIATGENTVRAVIGCICYDYLMQDYSRTDVHLDGLERIINLRGGLKTLAHQPQVKLMIFWIDVASALVRNRPPRFALPTDLVPPLTPPRPFQEDVASFGQLTEKWEALLPPLSLDILDILRDLKTLCTVMDGEHASVGEPLWQNEIFVGLRVNPIAHKLLSISPSQGVEPFDLRIREACRLGALLTIICLKMKCSSYPGSLPEYAPQILAAMEEQYMSLPDLVPLRLWLLVLAGITSGGAQREAVATVLIDSMRLCGIFSWSEVMKQVQLMPWMDSLLREAGSLFGREVMEAFAIDRSALGLEIGEG
ncbi:hypothetical protein NA57DRAFT_81079 [Rhizodiscina lignyota]|uniref:Uncharacterized protein n=1 Tax=Rhizodiscina lignyota TaxID=1504668 RepID=A0A9P4I608_9PEZI|nr:hypothetical protein NA57DRAFT_81079 [Rhizodiscina lignyota]